jgi:hypothetical protein
MTASSPVITRAEPCRLWSAQTKIGSQQRFEQLPMVRQPQVEQFLHDDPPAKRDVLPQQVYGKRSPSFRGA